MKLLEICALATVTTSSSLPTDIKFACSRRLQRKFAAPRLSAGSGQRPKAEAIFPLTWQTRKKNSWLGLTTISTREISRRWCMKWN